MNTYSPNNKNVDLKLETMCNDQEVDCDTYMDTICCTTCGGDHENHECTNVDTCTI